MNDSIPLVAVALHASVDEAVLKTVQWTGSHGEIALGDLEAAKGAEFAELMQDYWARTQALWREASGEGVIVRRPVLRARQTDGKEGRLDLAVELDALALIPLGEAMCGALLDAETHLEGLDTTQQGAVTTLRFSVRSHEWPDALGGPPSPGEITRHIELSANHAKWRDRRLRRLCAVAVDVEELWAAPLAGAFQDR
jgi:hypothetical protein